MDLILYNGNIITMDKNNPTVEAVAILEGKIIKIGKSEDILPYKKSNSKLINLNKKLALPGFIDSHMHLLNYGLSKQMVDLANCHSINELTDNIKKFILCNHLPTEKWIRGLKFNDNLFIENRLPTKYDLDKISTDHPIVISRVCGHLIIANSKALELASINDTTSQVKGGHFDLDESREPIGIFRENAIKLILKQIPQPTKNEIKEILKLSSRELITYGITSIHSEDLFLYPNNYDKVINAYKELAQEGNLPIRVYQQCYLPDVNSICDFISKGYNTNLGDEFFKIGPLKIFIDGSLGARTAYLQEPYSDDSTTCGIPVYTDQELDQIIKTAHNLNMQIVVHAIGDKAMHSVCNSFEKAQKENTRENARHAIIHCQITDSELFNRFKELNLTAIIQPLFVSTDMHYVEKRIGKERGKYSYGWKSFLDKEVTIACSSDCPVEPANVMYGIYAAVTRKDLNGFPSKGWLPEQKLTVEQAVYGYTMGGAYTSFEDKIKGSITQGKIADIVVLSDNIFMMNPDNIKDVNVELTIINGKIID